MLHDTLRDARHACRQLIAAPTFSLVAIVTLALGVGANTAIFSIIHGLLLRPLPYPEPERLLFVEGVQAGPQGETGFQLSYPDVGDIRAAARTIEAIAPWANAWGLALEGTEGAARLEANFVGRGYFSILGVSAMRGRTFAPEDHTIGSDASLVAILSENAWRQHFGADPAIVGTDIRLQGRVFTVVGVMPHTFHDPATAFGGHIDVWAPIERAPVVVGGVDLTNRSGRLMWGVARLAPGASAEAAAAELDTIGRQAAAAHPATNTSFTFRPALLAHSFFGDARRPLWLLLGGSAFVLLIACANVANLLLVRSSARARELAVRLAIGASRARIARQLLIESLVLSFAGSGLGVLAAAWTAPLLMRMSGIDVPAFTATGIDGTVLAASAATAIACGVLFGFAPIWRASSLRAGDTIAAHANIRVTGSRRGATMLVVLEQTAAFVLVAGAFLLLQSFAALTRTDLMFRTDRLLTVRLELPSDRYGTPALRAAAGDRLLERLRALPGVEHAIIWGPSMFARSTWIAFLGPTDRVITDAERVMVSRHSTNPGALGALQVPIVAGRDLQPSDTLSAPLVAIVSESAAERLWPGESALGRQVRTGAGSLPVVTIVGIAADARHRGRFRFNQGAIASQPQLDIYLPYAQRPNSLVTLGVRTTGDPAAFTQAVRRAVADVDPAIPIYDVESLAQRMRDEEAPVAFAALLLNLYGLLAVLLAGIGVYGVLASSVSVRLRELGIRSALGAEPRRLVLGVMRQGLAASALAVALGAALAFVLTRTFGGFLYGVSANVLPLIAVAAVLLAMAAAASVIPARRAAAVDPVTVLRAE